MIQLIVIISSTLLLLFTILLKVEKGYYLVSCLGLTGILYFVVTLFAIAAGKSILILNLSSIILALIMVILIISMVTIDYIKDKNERLN
jgi:uncharacterized membrane protein